MNHKQAAVMIQNWCASHYLLHALETAVIIDRGHAKGSAPVGTGILGAHQVVVRISINH